MPSSGEGPLTGSPGLAAQRGVASRRLRRAPALGHALLIAGVAGLVAACGDEPARTGGRPGDAPPADVGGPGGEAPGMGAPAPADTAEAHDWQIVGGTRLGPVDGTSTEASLTALLGDARVARRQAHLGEGFCAPATVLYPGTPDEAEVLWSDSARTRAALARVGEPGGRWRTPRGVGVGTTLRELEALAGGVVEFTGFGWDYGGRMPWPEGAPEGAQPLLLELAPQPDSTQHVASDPRYPEVLGEDPVRSDHPLLRRLDVRVERISVRFAPPPAEAQCPLP